VQGEQAPNDADPPLPKEHPTLKRRYVWWTVAGLALLLARWKLIALVREWRL
jgi:hypothetical protein